MAPLEGGKVKATLTGTTTILCVGVLKYERKGGVGGGQMQSRWEIKKEDAARNKVITPEMQVRGRCMVMQVRPARHYNLQPATH